MKVVLVYIHPSVDLKQYQPLARRFVQTYQEHPPGDYPHELYVLVNGFKYFGMEKLFEPLPVQYLTHNNVGRDLGAYTLAAQTIPCDLLLCLGSPVFFHRPGWLDRMVDAYITHGPGFYGAFACLVPRPHVRTTCFWCPPELLRAYPYFISTGDRYEAEHGRDSYTLWSRRMGFTTGMVTWDGVYEMKDWHQAPKSQCLMLDQHVERHHLPSTTIQAPLKGEASTHGG